MQIATYETEKEAKLLAIGDLHISDNPDIVGKVLSVVGEYNPDFVFLLGDLINGNSRDSVSNPFEAKISPEEELELATEFISKLSTHSTIACAIRGNHEYRMANKFGVDALSPVFQMLNIPYDDVVIVDISIRDGKTGSRDRVNYTIACAHGISGGRYEEASIRQNRYFREFFTGGIDIYFTGHTHKPAVSWSSLNEFDKHNKKVLERITTMITVSGMQDSAYAERKFLRPTPLMLTFITLTKNKRRQIIENVFI